MKTKTLISLIGLLSLLGGIVTAAPLGTAFSYQGRLTDGGAPANGSYDFQVAVFDAASGPSQIGPTRTNSAVGVSNGLFTTTLDFGGGVFPGDARWLEIALRTNGGAAFTTLSPRQPLTSAPYALYAPNAGNAVAASTATVANGVANNAVTAPGIAPGQVVKSLNGLRDAVTVAVGANATLATNGQTLTLSTPTDWHLDGNSGTVPGTHFLGTTDNQPLELKVNGLRALRLEPNTNGAPNIIGGALVNGVAPGVIGATIAGGGVLRSSSGSSTNFVGDSFGTISGGSGHTIFEMAASSTIGGGFSNFVGWGAGSTTIGGGSENLVDSMAYRSTVGGGFHNLIGLSARESSILGGSENSIAPSAIQSAIGGGHHNRILPPAIQATIAGGLENTISGRGFSAIGGGVSNSIGGAYASVPGGLANTAGGDYSFAAGRRAKADHAGTFVWADSTDADFASSVSNQFAVRARGGAFFDVYDSDLTIHGILGSLSASSASDGFRLEASTPGKPLILGLNGQSALRVVAGPGTVNLAGAAGWVSSAIEGATIAGGGDGSSDHRVSADFAAIGGGRANVIERQSDHATIAGGYANTISTNAGYATIAGGHTNLIEGGGWHNTIGGGFANFIQSGANSSTIVGGEKNSILGGAWFATVLGGESSTAMGDDSMAGGRRGKAIHDGSFVWADAQDADFASTSGNQFSVRAQGGVRFVTGGAGLTIDGETALSGLVEAGQLAAGAVVSSNLAPGAVTSTAIADGTITPADVNVGSFSNTFWKTDGNVGTMPGTNFLGTTDNRPVELWANGQRSFRLEPGAYVAPNVVGGSASNVVGTAVIGATIAGGGTHGYTFSQFPTPGPISPFPPTIHPNRVSGDFGTVGGGAHNFVGPATLASTVGGGYDNAVADSASIATVSGGANNWILTNAIGAAIGGGRDNLILNGSGYARIGGGRQNWVYPGAQYITIGGGATNTIMENAVLSSIGGGGWNTVQPGVQFSTIGGGGLNTIGTNTLSGTIAGGAQNQLGAGNLGSTIGGGGDHLIANNTRYGTIPGGLDNTVAGDYGFAAGRRARAWHVGSFVWADSANADFSSTGTNQFLIRASGGVGIGGAPVDALLDVEGDIHLNDHDLFLRGGSDRNHGLGWYGLGKPFAGVTVDGPVAYGWNGGALGTLGPEKIVLFWNWQGQVGIGTSTPGAPLDVVGTVRATAFEGNGSGLANCNADLLDGLDSSAFWKTGGNAGTTPGTHFLGTTDNKAIEFKVNGQRALRIEPNTNGAPNLIGGSPYNVVGAGVIGATIGGGGAMNYLGAARTNSVLADFSVIGGGRNNAIGDESSHATIAGGISNTIGTNSYETTIGGGHYNNIADNTHQATIGGGFHNDIGPYCGASVIGGGYDNRILTTVSWATIAGGYWNGIGSNSHRSAIGGGDYNNIETNADSATIAGGQDNLIGPNARYAAIPGGQSNQVSGAYGMAAGRRAKANHQGAFVWADSTDADFASSGNNQFCVRAAGGLRVENSTSQYFGWGLRQMLNLNDTGYGIGIQDYTLYNRTGSRFSWFKGGSHSNTQNDPGVGGSVLMSLTSTGLVVNGVFVSSSDRNRKAGFVPVNSREVLEKVSALPLSTWTFKEDAGTRHIGPMAQDFHAAFGVGADDTHIATVDADGVALAAIQGLNEKVEAGSQKSEVRSQELEARSRKVEGEVTLLRAENAELKRRLDRMEQLLAAQNGGGQ